jgi:lysozyme family protein
MLFGIFEWAIIVLKFKIKSLENLGNMKAAYINRTESSEQGTFDKAIKVILRHEGGYVNDPDDPGGETKFGISKRAFPDVDIKNLTEDQAKKIYFDRYWEPLNLHLLQNEELKLNVFDHGVNAGRGRAVRMLQEILECKKDGVLGPVTARAANSDTEIVDKYKQSRIKYYRGVATSRPQLKKFLRGWLNRVESTNFN